MENTQKSSIFSCKFFLILYQYLFGLIEVNDLAALPEEFDV